MSIEKLKRIRNCIIIGTIVVGFILWVMMPNTIKNSAIVHAGTGERGSKYWSLPILLLPLFALIPQKNNEDIHSQEAGPRSSMLEKRERRSVEGQIFVAVIEAVVVLFCMGLGIMAGMS